MAACATTLGIAELLECTLLHLPLKDLLLAQCVSKVWRNLIQDSKRAKQVLFLEATSESEIFYDVSGSAWKTAAGIELPGNPVVNPLLHPHINYWQWQANEMGSVRILHEGFINPVNPRCPGKKMVSTSRALHRATASWRSMVLLQPRASMIELYCTDSADTADPSFLVHNPEGVTLGEVVQRLRDHWHICPNCPYEEDFDNCWEFTGDEDVDVVRPDITGWEMMAEFARQA
ncbi:hypothetical protein LTR36_006628 [Oleoguttula mirabilis]|uniref:F-box domain-containing protein n=1 Tax=Oleoguttula mirabilis TaxID=1507867 RepID=A0AAV9JDW0_9PEZI|nr:hypothetical protein LTR36_006628 [Oleoguttula mirabilis]